MRTPFKNEKGRMGFNILEEKLKGKYMANKKKALQVMLWQILNRFV